MSWIRLVVLAAVIAAGAAAPAVAQPTSPILFDPQMSTGAGAALMATFGETLARAEETFIPHRLLEETGAGRRATNVAYRLGRVLFFDAPQERLVMVVNHEVFGHGARLRERFDGPIGYQIGVPEPYGNGGGSTKSVLDREPSLHEQLAIHAAGMEASATAADVLATRALARGTITPRDAMRYLEFELDTLSYVLSTDDDEEPGHDVAAFLQAYNEFAGTAGSESLSARTLKRQAYASLANPVLGYAVWSIGRYLATGATDSPVPALHIGGVRYLPLVRYRLTPFGTEWGVVNELGGRIRPTQIELRLGRAFDERPWGVALRHSDLPVAGGWRTELSVSVWKQPRFLESADEPFPPDTRMGAHVRGRFERPLIPVWFSGRDATLIVEVGTKSAGYVPGEPLGAAVIGRAGIGLPFN